MKIKKIILISLFIGSLIFSFLSGFYFHFNQYDKVQSITNQISSRKYDLENYNCINFSKDTQKLLKEKGIESVVIYGNNGGKYDHAVIGILIEPQTGKFINNLEIKGILQ